MVNVDMALFGPVWGASGVQGFFGEGYRFHGPWLNFKGMTFVAKTATLSDRAGNMILDQAYLPKQWFPDCVKVKFIRGVALNAVGLSNPGLSALLDTGYWQQQTQPFMISLMSLADSPAKRLDEYRQMADMLGQAMSEFRTPFGLQVNLSCPNAGHNPAELIGESAEVLNIVGTLGVSVVPKYSIASAPIKALLELDGHPHCQAISISNTLPFGWSGIDWTRSWGSTASPLAHLGGGGLSGAPLRPLVRRYIFRLREEGFSGHINGGGGILLPDDVDRYHDSGASSVSLGTVAMLRPWRVQSIIKRATSLQWA